MYKTVDKKTEHSEKTILTKNQQPKCAFKSAITFPKVRLIDPHGAFIGIVDSKTALQKQKNRIRSYMYNC